MEKQKHIQNAYNYYTIPHKGRKKAHRLYLEAYIQYSREEYEEALYLFKESYRLNPYSSGLKEKIIEIEDFHIHFY